MTAFTSTPGIAQARSASADALEGSFSARFRAQIARNRAEIETQGAGGLTRLLR